MLDMSETIVPEKNHLSNRVITMNPVGFMLIRACEVYRGANAVLRMHRWMLRNNVQEWVGNGLPILSDLRSPAEADHVALF